MYAPLDFILARPSAVRLLRVLEPLESPVSAREAARRAGLTHAATSVLDQLRAVGILLRRETPAQHLYAYNHSHVLAGAIARLFHHEREAEAQLLAELRAILDPQPVVASALFGSVATGRARAGSDLDVLVIVRDAEQVESTYGAFVTAWEPVRQRFGLSLSPVVMDLGEARRQWRGGNAFLLSAVRDARSLMGEPLEGVLS
jgi:predicted nucleotidyltransferase